MEIAIIILLIITLALTGREWYKTKKANDVLRGNVATGQVQLNAISSAVVSLHQVLFAPMGIGGTADQWYNNVWRLFKLDEKGAPKKKGD